jgi:hypothetical protein
LFEQWPFPLPNYHPSSLLILRNLDQPDFNFIYHHLLQCLTSRFHLFLISAESDLTAFSERKSNFKCRHEITTNLLCPNTRPPAVQILYEAATTPITPALKHVNPGAAETIVCTPILGAKRKRNVDEIETRKVRRVDSAPVFG